jgi:uncharacterized protein (TIGR03435 family)
MAKSSTKSKAKKPASKDQAPVVSAAPAAVAKAPAAKSKKATPVATGTSSARSAEPLTGKALVQKVKECNRMSKRETAKECGYFTTKNGKDRTDLSGFYNALLSAKGLQVDSASRSGRGAKTSYKTSVHKNGQIVIGSAYTKEMGLKEGDEFEIVVGRKNIRLVQVDRG